MAETPKHSDPEFLDPAKRAALGVSIASEEESPDEEVRIVDEKLKEKEKRWREEQEEKKRQEEALIGVDEALSAESVLEIVSNRDKIRVLVITKDKAVLRHGSSAERRFLEYSAMFAEVHVVVLSEVGESPREPDRIEKNVWVYPTNSKSVWGSYYDGYTVAKKQLDFGGGFRVDIILAEDPFDSALLGYFLMRKYNRPLQVHVLKDYFDPYAKQKESAGRTELFIARLILSRATSVRTKTETIKAHLLDFDGKLEPVTSVLPRYYDFDAWRNAPLSIDLKERYPMFKFILLHASSGLRESESDVVLRGVVRMLRWYPTIGLVVLCDETEVDAIHEIAARIGVQDQVVFVTETEEFVSCIRSANVVVQMSGLSDEEHMILAAAALGTPLVVGEEGVGAALFEDGESAFICPKDNASCISEKLNRLLNENQLRAQFSRYGKTIVEMRVEQDYESYLALYRYSIERSVYEEG